jgi:hypothetical protein
MAWDHVAVEGNAPDHRNGKSATEVILAQEKIFGARKDTAKKTGRPWH